MNFVRKSLFFVILFVGTTAPAFSGVLTDDPRLFPVLIVHQSGIGSGCILELSNSVYLVTAKHVLYADPIGTNPPTLLSPNAILKGFVRENGTNFSEHLMTLDLSKLDQSGEVRYSSNRDVAIVRIEDCMTSSPVTAVLLNGVSIPSNQAGALTMWPPMFVCPISEIEVGDDVFMFGYPVSLTGKFDPWEPLLRKGSVAGVNLRSQTVIIDCPSYQGNSGGPVVEVEHPLWNITRLRIVGLVSGFVPFEEEWENKTLHYSHVLKSNSGYTVIEPMDTVLNLVWK